MPDNTPFPCTKKHTIFYFDIILCSTVIGSFFQDFVKIFNKIKTNVVSELKIGGHTN